MILFLLTFLFVYGGIHVYSFMRMQRAFHFSTGTEIILAGLFFLLGLAPIMVRIAENRQMESLAGLIAYAGFLWMGFIFLFFILNLSFNFIALLIRLFPGGAGLAISHKITFGLAVFISLALVVYGFIDASRLRTKHLEINTPLLPNNSKIRLAQISDVHVGLIVREKKLKAILDEVKKASPDILISTGDLLDSELDNVLPLADLFGEIQPKFGKYAVTGNHEYYAGIDRSLEFTRRAGFEVLRDEVREVAGIIIVGVDDITGRRNVVIQENARKTKTMPEVKNDRFVLLLKHQPYVNESDNFNLQISGHTHGGQIFPFRLITGLFFKNNYGYFELAKNKFIYVNRGAGTWGPPIRVFAPPEITVIDLLGKK